MKYIFKNSQIRVIHNIILLILVLISFSQVGCKKFLDEKPDKRAVVPTTLSELQRLLDNNSVMNTNGPAALAELVADDYYVSPDMYEMQASSENINDQAEADSYIWALDGIPFDRIWNDSYRGPIYYSNIILDQLPLISYTSSEQEKYDNIKGSALFIRAFHFHQLAQLFCKPYSTGNANDLGIVLRLTSNISAKSSRATIEQTYNQIIADLKLAAELLSEVRLFKTQPSKAAAYAALARVYLTMRNYEEAGKYADEALQLNSSLINYNNLLPVGPNPIPIFNEEIIFYNYSITPLLLFNVVAKIDSNLYKSYNSDDMRKEVFFIPAADGTPTYGFAGSYEGQFPDMVFDGLAVDELYLIRAESFARSGKTSEALNDLNTLMMNRWRDGLFTPFTAANANEALNMILAERRKELLYRGIRWSDIRRLNLESANIVLKREISGNIYTLPANDPRSVMLIPWDEINRSGIQQNVR